MARTKGKKKTTRQVVLICLRVALAVAVVLAALQIGWYLRPVKEEQPLPVLEESPYTAEDFYWEDGFLRCSAGEVKMGIDVSVYQGDIDWARVKDAGVEYAFVRLGSRGYGDGKLRADEKAMDNLRSAKAAGISVGAYVFSQAISVEEALEEAEFALEKLEGMALDLPLVFDWEYISETARTAKVTRRLLTDCTAAFCRAVEEAGYEAMVYFNQTQARDLLYLEELTAYKFWLAMYDTAGTFPCKVDFWQYTSTGKIPGIQGDVDINLMFLYKKQISA